MFQLDFVGLKTKEEYKVLKEAAVDHEAEEAKYVAIRPIAPSIPLCLAKMMSSSLLQEG